MCLPPHHAARGTDSVNASEGPALAGGHLDLLPRTIPLMRWSSRSRELPVGQKMTILSGRAAQPLSGVHVLGQY